MFAKRQKGDTIEPRLVTISDAANLLGVCRKKVYDLIEAGEIQSIKWDRLHRVTVASIATWIARQVQHADHESPRAHDATDTGTEPQKTRKTRKRRGVTLLP